MIHDEGAQEAQRVRGPPRSRRGGCFVGVCTRAQVETKYKTTETASSHCGSHGAARSEVQAVAGEGKACRQFFAPFGDLDVPKGFAKNGDTIEIENLTNDRTIQSLIGSTKPPNFTNFAVQAKLPIIPYHQNACRKAT